MRNKDQSAKMTPPVEENSPQLSTRAVVCDDVESIDLHSSPHGDVKVAIEKSLKIGLFECQQNLEAQWSTSVEVMRNSQLSTEMSVVS